MILIFLIFVPWDGLYWDSVEGWDILFLSLPRNGTAMFFLVSEDAAQFWPVNGG